MGDDDAGPDRDHAKLGQRLRQVVERCTATARSADSSVQVTAGAGGMVVGIEVTGQASRHDGRTLGRMVLEAASRAATEVGETLAAETRSLTTGAVDVAGLLQGRLPVPPPLDPLPTLEPEDATGAGGTAGGTGKADETAGGPADNDDTFAKLRRIREDAERRLVAYESVRSQFADQLTTVQSPDGGVRVTVRGTGTLVDVSIDDATAGLDPLPLAQALLVTIQSAYAQAARQLAARTQQLVGPALDIAGLADIRRRPGRPAVDPAGGEGGQGGRIRR